MRTSMNLPDALLDEAKALAAAEGSTVTQLVVEGLRARVSAASIVTRSTVSLPRRKLGPARVDIGDNRAVHEVLEADRDEQYRDPR
jgi:hypothetical protein